MTNNMDIDQRNLYEFRIIPHLKNFKNQRIAQSERLEEVDVGSASIDDLKATLFNLFRNRIDRKAILADIATGVYSRAAEEPTVEDTHSYFLFYHTQNKHSYMFGSSIASGTYALTTTILNNWTTMAPELHLYIFRYSLVLTTQQAWLKFSADCLPRIQVDRAGAVTEERIREIKEMLKLNCRGRFNNLLTLITFHSFQCMYLHSDYVSEDMNWYIWASYIAGKSNFDHLVTQPPPTHLIHLFARSPRDDTQHVFHLRESNAVARHIVETMQQQLADLIREQQRLANRTQSVVDSLNVFARNLNAFETAVGPMEPTVSMALRLSVTNQADIDHA
jgi:hypothetical protein